MGAMTFTHVAKGGSVTEAFATACEEAAWEHGHGGYTGTVAEKHEFVLIIPPTSVDRSSKEAVYAYAEKLIEECDPRIDSKWGPAGAIALPGDEFLFFGWASC